MQTACQSSAKSKLNLSACAGDAQVDSAVTVYSKSNSYRLWTGPGLGGFLPSSLDFAATMTQYSILHLTHHIYRKRKVYLF